MRLLITVIAILIGTLAFAQNDPEIISVSFEDNETFCFNDYKTLTVVVNDADGDVPVINLNVVNSYLEYFNGAPSETVGNTTTYQFDFIVSSLAPPAPGTIVLETIQVEASSGNGSDPTGLDNMDMTDVEVQGLIEVNFTDPTLYMCEFGNPVDLTQYVDVQGGTFYYSTGFPSYESNSTALNLTEASTYFYNNDYSMYIDYYITDETTGCQGSTYADLWFYTNPTVNVTANPSTCGSADGSAIATISGSAPYNVYWTTGFSEVSSGASTVSNLSSGVYYINVTDINGCKNVARANIYDGDMDVTETITESKCQGQTGSIELDILPGPGTVESIHWSNGATGTTLNAHPGEYSVAIHTTANCNFFGTYEIPDSALRVDLYDQWSNSDCISTPNGLIDIYTSGGNGVGSYTWDWTKNGVGGFSTMEDLYGITGGVYECTVSDGTGCELTWSTTVENYNNVYLWIDQITQPKCGEATGAIDIQIDTWGDTPTSYVWSNGATSEDLTNLVEGTYTLTYSDLSGCTNYLTIELFNERPYQPTICLLTVDTSLIYNMIVWEKDITQDIEGFNIYRETSTFGQYELVAQRPYALESFFQDNDASPADRSWRYYITTYDACGEESYPSFVHKTIHVVSNSSDMINYNISWDDYEGISYSSVDLFRFDDTNGWQLAANLPYGTNTFTEAPLVVSGLDYMVSFNLTDPCTSTKAQDHNSSRSNKTASVFMPGGSTAQIQDEELGIISIYPNPTNDMINLHVDNPELFNTVEITDVNGRTVYTNAITEHNTVIDLYDFTSGVYFVRIYSANKVITHKVIKN